MALRLSPHQLQAIQSHADRTYPDECCGLLLGRSQAGDKVVVAVRSVQNSWSSEAAEVAEGAEVAELLDDQALSQARRYWIAPEEMLVATREARSHNLDIIGIYHSHPDNRAVPSECDRTLAWPQYSYVIVSVQNGQSQDCQSWVLDDRHQFQPESIDIMAPAFP